jgi:hypothetical protein
MRGVLMSDHDRAVTPSGRVIDAHRLAEFVYGTVTGLVAIAGIGGHPESGWLGTTVAVVTGATAIWLAHGYSILLSKRVTLGRRLTGGDIAHVFSGSWPIVTAGFVLALPILASGLGLWDLEMGITLSGYVGIGVLALVGLLAGAIANETWSRRLLLAAISGSFGFAVVAIEYVVHH